MLNSRDLKLTLGKKEREWRELQILHTRQLEAALKEATTELNSQKKYFQYLQEDFQFNLKLLEERDHKLKCYDAIVTKFQTNDCVRQEEVSELHIQIGKLQYAVMQEKRVCAALYIMHQQKMAELQLHLNTVCSEKHEEIQRLKEENESLKSRLKLEIQEAEGELALQKQELMAYFDGEMQKQEHGFNLRIDGMCTEVLSYKLKEELMSKELDVHTRTYSQATQALQASEDQCYRAHKEIQHKEWVLKNTISMKDARIQELEDQLSQREFQHAKEEERVSRMYAELEGHAQEGEMALAEMRAVHAKQLCEAKTKTEELQTQLDVLPAEQTIKNKSYAKESQQREQELLKLRTELEATRSSWDTYITEVSKDMIFKDTKLLMASKKEMKLQEELDRCNEEVKRYKQQVANGLKREQTLEQKLVKLELHWKKHCENIWAKDYIRDKELVDGLALSRDKVMVELHDKDKELKRMSFLLNAVTMERDQALQGKLDGLLNNSQQTCDFPSMEMCQLQKQNAHLRAVVAEMRKEMEGLTRVLPAVQTVSHTKDRNTQTCPADRMEETDSTKEEIKELKVRCLHFDDCLEEGSTTATPAPRPTASKSLVSHIRNLRNTIDRLQVEKVSNVAALKEKQVRITFLETALAHFLQQSHCTQTEKDELLQELFNKKRCSCTKEENGKDGQRSCHDYLKNIDNSTIPDKLRQAVRWTSRLTREKQKLIELGNCLRAQLSEAGLEVIHHVEELVPATEGKLQGCSHLSTLEHLQYQLASQKLQYAQRNHNSKSSTRPILSKSQHEYNNESKQSNKKKQQTLCTQENIPTLSRPSRSCTIPSSPWMSSIDTNGSLQDVWKILEKGPSPSIATPTESIDQGKIEPAIRIPVHISVFHTSSSMILPYCTC